MGAERELGEGEWFDAFADSHTLRLPTKVYAAAYRDKPEGKKRGKRFLKVFRRQADVKRTVERLESLGCETERLVGTITWEALDA